MGGKHLSTAEQSAKALRLSASSMTRLLRGKGNRPQRTNPTDCGAPPGDSLRMRKASFSIVADQSTSEKVAKRGTRPKNPVGLRWISRRSNYSLMNENISLAFIIWTQPSHYSYFHPNANGIRVREEKAGLRGKSRPISSIKETRIRIEKGFAGWRLEDSTQKSSMETHTLLGVLMDVQSISTHASENIHIVMYFKQTNKERRLAKALTCEQQTQMHTG